MSRRRRRALWLAAAAVAAFLVFALLPAIQRSLALRRADTALARNDYGVAVAELTAVLQADPDHPGTHAALARVYARQYVSGGETPENLGVARKARTHLRALLDRDPENADAIARLARIELAGDNFDEALQWADRLLALSPDDAEGHYLAASIVSRRVAPVLLSARAAAGMLLEEPGPIADTSQRAELRRLWLGEIEAAIAAASRVVAIDASHAGALALLGTLERARADLAGSTQEYAEHMRLGGEWANKAAAARLSPASAAARQEVVSP